jgi:hypothetical protein
MLIIRVYDIPEEASIIAFSLTSIMLNAPQASLLNPVCIADLPASDFHVSPETLTEDVVSFLENSPDVPGVLLLNENAIIGLITRLKLFERLGHRYGVELFLRKPVIELNRYIGTKPAILSGHLKIDAAVQQALSRHASDIYDPVVVDVDRKYRILDINVLLLAQSRIVSNLSNVVGKLQHIENLMRHDYEKTDLFHQLLQLLGQVVPYHQAAVVAEFDSQLYFAAAVGFPDESHAPINRIKQNQIYKLMMKHRQAIYVPEASLHPVWKGMESLGMPSSWLGVPLLSGKNCLGLLSLGRNVKSPFTSDEKETSQAFAQQIVAILSRPDTRRPGIAHEPAGSLIGIV